MINIEKLDIDEALRYMGYKGQAIDENMSALIEDAGKQCLSCSRPAYIYKLFDISHDHEKVNIQNSSLSFEGKSIYKHLKGCSKCAIMAVTIGAGFDSRLTIMQQSDPTKAVIFNSCGSALIEQVCDAVEQEILEKTGMNKHNFRFSPGYGDLPLETQKTIFRVLSPEKTAGINLTPTNLLIPVKSVTAILGLSETKREITTDKCSLCSLRDTCKLRKGGNTCDGFRTH